MSFEGFKLFQSRTLRNLLIELSLRGKMNIFEMLPFTVRHTPLYGREMFYTELNNYISDINTSQFVK